jgi:hypothetical protein
VAADLIPYDNGYIPEQYYPGSPGAHANYPGYEPNGNYGAEPRYCDLNDKPLADDREGLPEPCAPDHPYPAAVSPNGPHDHYSYQPGYDSDRPPSAILPNDRYGDHFYRPPSAIAPNDRYGDHSYQRGYESDHPPSAIAPNDRYGGYSYQRSYESGPPPSAPPPNYNYDHNPYQGGR